MMIVTLVLLCSLPAPTHCDDEPPLEDSARESADSHDANRLAKLRRVAQEKTRQIKANGVGAHTAGVHAAQIAALRSRAPQLQRAMDPTPPASYLASVSVENYGEWLVEAAGGTVVVFFHASFCKQCPTKLSQFAEAAAVLEQRGYPHGMLAALDTSLGGSAGAAPRLFANPCVSCPACTGYPCILTIDIDDEGHSSGTLWGPRPVTAEMLVSITVQHLQQRGIQPNAAGAREGDRTTEGERVAPDVQLQVQLQDAAREGNATMLAALLAAGADPNAGVPKEEVTSNDERDGGVGDWTALHEVAARGRCVECAVLLAARGANISSLPVRDRRGLSAADVARKAVRSSWDRVLAAEAEAARSVQSEPPAAVHDRELR
jgi:hypothetical protein